MNAPAPDLRRRFREAAREFTTSPLYQRLCSAIADDEFVLGLLEDRRKGQDPPFLLFGAVHYLLLSGLEHPLSRYYASLDREPVPPNGQATVSFRDFCLRHELALRSLISERLVQTNVVNRAIAMRYALWWIGRQLRQPVHLIDIGTSAATHLAFDRYRYDIGSRRFGDLASPVRLVSDWRSTSPVPDLDALPPILTRTGIDLNPINVTDPNHWLWLRALVWPEDRAKDAILTAALAIAAQSRPKIHGGDAADVIRRLAETWAAPEPTVVFHAAVRMHLAPDAVAAFDDAIDALGRSRPLFHVWLEPASAPHHRFEPHGRGGLQLHGPGNEAPVTLAETEGHLAWIKPSQRGLRMNPAQSLRTFIPWPKEIIFRGSVETDRQPDFGPCNSSDAGPRRSQL